MNKCAHCDRQVPYELCFTCDLIARGWAEVDQMGWGVFITQTDIRQAVAANDREYLAILKSHDGLTLAH